LRWGGRGGRGEILGIFSKNKKLFEKKNQFSTAIFGGQGGHNLFLPPSVLHCYIAFLPTPSPGSQNRLEPVARSAV